MNKARVIYIFFETENKLVHKVNVNNHVLDNAIYQAIDPQKFSCVENNLSTFVSPLNLFKTCQNLE